MKVLSPSTQMIAILKREFPKFIEVITTGGNTMVEL